MRALFGEDDDDDDEEEEEEDEEEDGVEEEEEEHEEEEEQEEEQTVEVEEEGDNDDDGTGLVLEEDEVAVEVEEEQEKGSVREAHTAARGLDSSECGDGCGESGDGRHVGADTESCNVQARKRARRPGTPRTTRAGPTNTT